MNGTLELSQFLLFSKEFILCLLTFLRWLHLRHKPSKQFRVVKLNQRVQVVEPGQSVRIVKLDTSVQVGSICSSRQGGSIRQIVKSGQSFRVFKVGRSIHVDEMVQSFRIANPSQSGRVVELILWNCNLKKRTSWSIFIFHLFFFFDILFYGRTSLGWS